MDIIRSVSVLIIIATCSHRAWAEDISTSTLSTGDLLILRSTADSLTPVLKVDGAGSGVEYTAPARTKFKVNSEKSGTLTVVVKDVPCERSAAPSKDTADTQEKGKVATISRAAQVFSSITVSEADCASPNLVREGHTYEISNEKLKQFGVRRLGFIYGGLVIPYKYFRHDKSLEPGTTIGPFVGYRLGQTGWGIAAIATYAVSDIKVKVVDGTELKEKTFFALSRGIGFMFDVTKSDTPFRAGIMWGRDRVGSNNVDVYPHNGRTWVAAQLGWEFGR